MLTYVSQSGEQTGPFTESELQAMLNAGTLNLQDHGWREGMAEWQPLHQILGIAPAPVAINRPVAVAVNRPVAVAAPVAVNRPVVAARPSAITARPVSAVQAVAARPVVAVRPDAVATGYQPMKLTDWLITFLIAAIPLVGLVMLFVWAFSKDTQPSKKTFCQAYLILMGVAVTLAILFSVIIGIGVAAAANEARSNTSHRSTYSR